MFIDRRTLLNGLPAMALGQLMAGGSTAPHHAPKAKRVLQIFCPGAASHIDLWDYKPELEKRHGQPMPGGEKEVSFQGANGNLMRSPWDFVPRGQSGKRLTSLLPHLGAHADRMAFIHSMTSRSNTHGPACVMMNTGYVFEGFPSAGAWVGYALGSANDNLPAYVAIPDIRGIPPSGPANWTAGFLPAQHQGIAFNAAEPILNLDRPRQISTNEEEATRAYLRRLNGAHAERHPGPSDLQARIAAYELAARMQLSAPEASDLSRESKATHQLYGTDDQNPLLAAYARNCLLARRLLERNVRYVQLFCASRASGVDGLLNWDAHKTLKADYDRHGPIFDKPTAGLISDLAFRGLLDDTLVLWTTEFGRLPTHQQGTLGRDHNPDAFTVWLLGAGIKGGTSYGATDEFGRRAVEDVTTVHAFWATVLWVLGLDYQKLSWYHNGLQRRLTDVHGHVLQSLLT
ncbi:MAG: DUF1501 domain-containing protein [Acidobacteria bacterium]|nr:DUF1501 domain-containing protein [Acidobacteriota bacterium]